MGLKVYKRPTYWPPIQWTMGIKRLGPGAEVVPPSSFWLTACGSISPLPHTPLEYVV